MAHEFGSMAAADRPGSTTAPEGPRTAEAPSCPLLGLPDDRLSRFSYPSVGHRCHAEDRPRAIDLGHQGAFCLTAGYPECARYQAAAASRRPSAKPVVAVTPPTAALAATPAAPAMPEASGVDLDRVRAGAGLAGTLGGHRTLGAPAGADQPGEPDRPGAPGLAGAPDRPGAPGLAGAPDRKPRGRASRWRRVVGIGIAVAVLAGAAFLASPAIADWMRQVGGGASAASPSPSSPPLASPASPAPTRVTPAPARTMTPDPTATATTTPTATPARTPVVHVVVRGETLIVIAARYGVTVTAIKVANGIADAGLIYIGQQLVIPPR